MILKSQKWKLIQKYGNAIQKKCGWSIKANRIVAKSKHRLKTCCHKSGIIKAVPNHDLCLTCWWYLHYWAPLPVFFLLLPCPVHFLPGFVHWRSPSGSLLSHQILPQTVPKLSGLDWSCFPALLSYPLKMYISWQISQYVVFTGMRKN